MKVVPVALLATAAIAATTGLSASAELPSRHPAAPPKARACSIDGVVGVELPGGGACVRITGSMSAGVAAGSMERRPASGAP